MTLRNPRADGNTAAHNFNYQLTADGGATIGDTRRDFIGKGVTKAHLLFNWTRDYIAEYGIQSLTKQIMFRIGKPKYDPDNLLEVLRRSTRCCAEFIGGHPTFVCRQPFVCDNCAHFRAAGIGTHYRSSMRKYFHQEAEKARSQRRNVIRILQLVIHRGVVWQPTMAHAIQEMFAIASTLRKDLNYELRRHVNLTGNMRLDRHVPLLFDTFVHISPKYISSLQNGEFVAKPSFFPHIHVTMRINSDDEQCLRDIVGMITRHCSSYKVPGELGYSVNPPIIQMFGPPGNENKKVYGVEEFGRIGYYNAKMFKLDHFSPPAHLICLSTLTSELRQFRKKDGAGGKINPAYPKTARTARVSGIRTYFDVSSQQWITE